MKIFVVSCDSTRFLRTKNCSMDPRLDLIYAQSLHLSDHEVYVRGDHTEKSMQYEFGVTACFIGHMNAMKTFLKSSGQEYGIIAEDDVRFHKNFYSDTLKLLPLMSEYDIISLGFVNQPFGTIEKYNGINIIKDVKVGNPWGTQCYIISRDLAKSFLERFDKEVISESSCCYNGTFSSDYVIFDIGRRVTLAVPIVIEEPDEISIIGNSKRSTIKSVELNDFYTNQNITYLKQIEDHDTKTRDGCEKISKLYFSMADIDNAEKWAMNAYKIEQHPETLYFLVKHFREKSQHYKSMHYYNLIKDQKDQVFDSLLMYEYSILHYYVNSDKISGEKFIINFINKYNLHRNNCMYNLQHYLPRISSIFNSKSMNIPTELIENGYFPSNTALLKTVDGKLIGNIRLINYKLNKQNGYYSLSHHCLKTKNMCLFFDLKTLEIINAGIIETVIYDVKANPESDINGIEDVRLFYRNGNVCYSASTKEYSYTNAIRIITGNYNYETFKFESNTVLAPPTETWCEKNWIFIEEDVIYSWFPMKIGKIVDGKLEIHTEHTTPNIFDGIRGSTHFSKRNNMYFGITHSCCETVPRNYYHYFMVLDSTTLKPIKMSVPFCFESTGTEYCLGMEIIDDDFIVTYSNNETNPSIIKIPISWVENILMIDV